jgi:hypothetical protein
MAKVINFEPYLARKRVESLVARVNMSLQSRDNGSLIKVKLDFINWLELRGKTA